MAILRSGHLANNETANPYVTNPASEIGGRIKTATNSYEVDGSELANGDVLLLERLPAAAVIRSLELASDSLDSGSALVVEVGVHKLDETAGDADVFASTVSDFQTSTDFTEYRFEADDIADINKKLWELAGDTDLDHDSEYYISVTITTKPGTPVDGTLSWRISYSVE